jgi:hypothetical protein
MQPTPDVRGRQALQYALDTLHALPCGCVAAVYHARPLDAELVAVEARGPHCLYAQHQVGRVLGLSLLEGSRFSR